MNVLKKLYCRVYQGCFRLALPVLPYREPKILGSLDELVPLLAESKLSSVLLVTDAFLAKGKGVARILEALRAAGIACAVYEGVQANPTVRNVEEAYALYKAHKAEALIAFGGGSPMDCAKAVGARAAYPNKSVNQMKGLLRVLKRIPPLVAIPTTAGTGSEVTLTAVITDGERHHKYTMNSFTLIPRYAILDPAATLSLPPALTATTGMDALTHAVEAYIGRSTTKETRALALEAVQLIFENLEAAYADGSDLQARERMLSAAYKAGIAFSKSYVGYVHAVAHSLGGQYNVPHGFANAVLLPLVLEEYGSCIDGKLARLGRAAGVVREGDDDATAAQRFIAAIRGLNERMGIPKHIDGIREEDIAQMSRYADAEANPLYPVPRLWNARELERIYRKVAEGSC